LHLVREWSYEKVRYFLVRKAAIAIWNPTTQRAVAITAIAGGTANVDLKLIAVIAGIVIVKAVNGIIT